MNMTRSMDDLKAPHCGAHDIMQLSTQCQIDRLLVSTGSLQINSN